MNSGWRVIALVFSALLIASCSQKAETVAEQDLAAAEDNWRQPLFEGLGGVDFKITTASPVAQQYFNQGLALSYAFNHAAADFAFTEATIYDPDCAMCYWGSALVLGPNVNANMTPANAPRAFALASKAKELSRSVGEKEQALIDALLARYQKTEPEDRSDLNEAYADAMRGVMKVYADDPHVAALAAESMMDVHPWDFWDAEGVTRPWTKEITDAIEHALALDPKHVGAIHLYIHAVEQSATPERAEPYADTLADLAPAAGHLVHMPAHIYMRVGRYYDATINNELATVADNNFIQACRSNSPIYLAGYIPHNWHFGWVTAAIGGWKSKAYELAEGTAAALNDDLLRAPGMGVAQHFLMQPMFARVRFADWQSILQAPEPAADLFYARGIWHYGRGEAYLGTGDLEKAEAEFESLAEIRALPELQAMQFFNREGAPALLEIAETVLAGSIAEYKGELESAIATYETAVVMEDALPYSEPPEWYFPVRHKLGHAQIQAEDYAGAEATYKRDLEIMVNNGWALRGLQQALEAQGKEVDAKQVQTRFEKAWRHADTELSSSILSGD